MSEQLKDKIKQYLHNLSEYKDIGDIAIYDEVKELVYQKYGTNFKYINNNIIKPIDRQIVQCNKYYKNIPIDNKQIELLTDYMESILDNGNHPLNKYIDDAISQNIIDGGWGEDIHLTLSIVGILQSILKDFHILNVFKEDEKKLITKKRDLHKIDEAIKLLSTYTDNIHVLHYLNTIKLDDKPISKSIILSSFFYHYTKILIEANFDFNKSQIRDIAQEIMSQVFNSSKDYRIYKYTTSIKYKDLTLTRYISK